jgi:hypothetical protein
LFEHDLIGKGPYFSEPCSDLSMIFAQTRSAFVARENRRPTRYPNTGPAPFRINALPKCRQPLPGWERKFNLVSYLSALWSCLGGVSNSCESVDAATPCLYKGGIGGGRNPAAAVL